MIFKFKVTHKEKKYDTPEKKVFKNTQFQDIHVDGRWRSDRKKEVQLDCMFWILLTSLPAFVSSLRRTIQTNK